jgi:antitoxin VapB
VSLNIKNERVHALAREAARRTGATQTSAIEQALEQLLASLDEAPEEEARRARLSALMTEIRETTTEEDRRAAKRAVQDLYDEHGLPA